MIRYSYDCIRIDGIEMSNVVREGKGIFAGKESGKNSKRKIRLQVDVDHVRELPMSPVLFCLAPVSGASVA